MPRKFKSILFQVVALGCALASLICVLNWAVGGYVGMQNAAEMKLTLKHLLPSPDLDIYGNPDGSVSALVVLRAEDMTPDQTVIDAYAPDAPGILVARIHVPQDMRVAANGFDAAPDGGALAQITVARDWETGGLVLSEPTIIARTRHTGLFENVGLGGAAIFGALAAILFVLAVRDTVVSQHATVSHRPDVPRPRNAREVRAARRFASLEHQDQLNATPVRPRRLPRPQAVARP